MCFIRFVRRQKGVGLGSLHKNKDQIFKKNYIHFVVDSHILLYQKDVSLRP